MNKDVIYIENEEDITDIIAKLKTAKARIVAFVPPKNSPVLKSAVNAKLIAKTARETDKIAVFVTTDPALMRFAMVARIPVTPDLQTAPSVPTAADLQQASASFTGRTPVKKQPSAEETSGSSDTPTDTNSPKKTKDQLNKKIVAVDQTITAIDLEDSAATAKSSATPKAVKKLMAKVPSLDKYRKWIILGSVIFILLTSFLVWALVFAPAATIAIKIKAIDTQFSETITFTLDRAQEAVDLGNFLLEENSLEKSSQVEFEATGQKNIGAKAKGELTVAHYFRGNPGTLNIPTGVIFTYKNRQYLSTAAASLTFKDLSDCENGPGATIHGCLISTKVQITAAEPGENYNISISVPAGGGWSSTIKQLEEISSAGQITGGTNQFIKVVQKSDIDKAKASIAAENEIAGKQELIEQIGEGNIIIETSFAQKVSDPISSPELDQEVKDGVTPTLTITTTFTIYSVDSVGVEDYIKNKATVNSDQKIYSISAPYFERFLKLEGDKYEAKLKATYAVGPKVSEESVLELIKGRKVGEVRSLVKGANGDGVIDVITETSFPWVTSIPKDVNKITIKLEEIKDQWN